MFISEKELNARLNDSFLRGREQGLAEGRLRYFNETHSLNDMRRAFGLPIIENGETKSPMTASAFYLAMKSAAEINDVEVRHEKMDGLMMNLLTDLGYKDAIDIFRNTEMWYA